jgi:hypothetical protein
MEEKNFTPEESLLLITKTIEETKKRFEENGFLLLFWGILIFFASLCQFVLTKLELNKIVYIENFTIRNWPVFLYPLGAFYTFIYVLKEYKKRNLPKTIIGNIIESLGWLLGGNLMILAFFFGPQLGVAFIPVLLILMAFWTIITGVSIRFKPLKICGIILNLIAFIPFFINWQYHPLVVTIASVVGFIIPGILLKKDQRKEHV